MADISDIAIRSLGKADQEAIAFTKRRLAEHWETTEETIERDYIAPSFAGGFPYIWIALAGDGRFVGKVILAIEKDGYLDIKDQPWFMGLFVKEEFRGQGIARQLVRTCEDKCREFGYKKLYLDTACTADYYRHIGGWEELGKVAWKKNGEELTIMAKAL